MVRTTPLIALALAGCQQTKVALVCPSGKPMELTGTGYAVAQSQSEACVANWGSRLAAASGSISELAEIVVDHCSYKINETSRLLAKSINDETRALDKDWQADVRSDAVKLARFEIARTRAGNCKLT